MSATGGATRSALLRAERQLERVRRGTELLKRKREALTGELFKRARPAIDARESLDEQARRAYAALAVASGVHGPDALIAEGAPFRPIDVDIEFRRIWGLPAPQITDRTPLRRAIEVRAVTPGALGPAALESADAVEAMLASLIDAAPLEILLRRLGHALARTSRQVRSLERRVAPRLEARTRLIRDRLQEREREEMLRLKHVLRKREAARGA